jgi:signal transduction histidine kinase
LFLAALAVPGLALGLLTYRVVRQDRELAERRTGEERRRSTERAYQDAANRLEQMKLRVQAGLHPAGVVVVAPTREEPGQPNPEIQAGETAEFVSNDFEGASAHYRRALEGASDPAQAAYARLLLARSRHRAGAGQESEAHWRTLLNTPLSVRDEFGVPFALYAGRQLHTVPLGALENTNALGATALYVLRDLTPDPAVRERIDWLTQVAPIAESLKKLAADYPLRDRWKPFGDPLWLAGQTADGTLLAVRPADVIPDLDPSGIELSADLPGIRVRLPASIMPEESTSHSLLYAALALVSIVTLAGGYLLWRDIQRESALAELRAQFVASVSHELKTPLTAIRMFAETLRLRGASSASLSGEYLDTIIHESERLSRLVDNILDFSKLERGDRQYQFRPLHLDYLVHSAAATMQYPLSQSGFHLEVSTEKSLPSVLGDADALEQVILNLLTNAMKYSGDAREIALRLRQDCGDAVIEVEDHGLGIAAEHQSKIFARFFRAPTAHNSQVPGAGLGLTLVEQTVRAHAGRIDVRSAPGKGSTFSVRIPLEATS